MVSDSLKAKLLEQVRHEWEAEYFYYSMMVWCMNHNFKGFAHWFRRQSQEEHGHGMKILEYLDDLGVELELPAQINVRSEKFKDVDHLFQLSLEHEKKVTGLIHAMVDQAIKENDHTTNNFLQWFVAEQLEEEATVRDILGILERIKGAPGGLYMLEKELASRET